MYSCADQRKHQSSASLVFVREIHRWPVNSLHKWPFIYWTRKMFPFDDVILTIKSCTSQFETRDLAFYFNCATDRATMYNHIIVLCDSLLPLHQWFNGAPIFVTDFGASKTGTLVGTCVCFIDWLAVLNLFCKYTSRYENYWKLWFNIKSVIRDIF